MKMVALCTLWSTPERIQEALRREELLVLTNGERPVAVLLPVQEENLEQMLEMLLRLRAQKAVQRMRALTQDRGRSGMSMEDIDAEVRAARQARAQE